VSPVGAHDATVGPGTGVLSPVSPTGAYQTAVPFDLPSPRGGLPVPFSLVYTGGGHGGAGGLGWEVPLWYVRVSRDIFHRKPAADSNTVDRDVVPDRVLLAMGGGPQLMVKSPAAGIYHPFVSDEYVELIESSGSWLVRTTANVEYRFTPAASYGLGDDTLWLLSEVHDRRATDRVVVEYQVADNGCGKELDVVGFKYGFDSQGNMPLYEVHLSYVSWAGVDNGEDIVGLPRCEKSTDDPSIRRNAFARSPRGVVRSQLLSSVRVDAHDNLSPSSAIQTLKNYRLEYIRDAATSAPRLHLVDMAPGMSGPFIPVASYEYGNIANGDVWPTDVGRGQIFFGEPHVVARDAAASSVVAHGISATRVSSDTWSNVREEKARTRFALRDLTGDGVPDLVYKVDSTWHLVRGRATDTGPTFDTGQTTTWQQPEDIHLQRTFRHTGDWSEGDRADMITTETLVEFIDWNGDGRLDVLDARGDDADSWTLWRNTSSGPNGLPVWAKVPISNRELRDHIARYNLQLGIYSSGWVALERSRTWQQLYSTSCTVQCSQDGTACGNPCTAPKPPQKAESNTMVEWTLSDANADGYVDIVAGTNRVRECDYTETAYETPYPFPIWTYHYEWMTRDTCTMYEDPDSVPADATVVYYNRAGALSTVAPRDYAPPKGSVAVGQWTTGEADLWTPAMGSPWPNVDPGIAWRAAGLIPDSVGRPTSRRGERDPDLEHYESDRHDVCGPGGGGSGSFTSTQVRGRADLNGDGMPDQVERVTNGWRVRFATSAGYGPQRQIISDPDFPFALSESIGDCDGDTMMIAGLLDLDGDGKPELVRVVDDVLMAASVIAIDSPDNLDIGRITAVENGYGARAVIRYANNKTDPYTPHQVAAPEIVVAETQTLVTNGSAPDSVSTRYGYGTVATRYDFGAGRTVFTGYRRLVTLVGGSTPRTGPTAVYGYAIVTDRSPPALPLAHHDEIVLGGRPMITSRYEGLLPADPRELLTPGTYFDRVRSQVMHVYGAVELPVGPAPDVGVVECMDIDVASGTTNFSPICTQAAIVYTKSTYSWEGEQEQGTSNVATLTQVEQVDARGRPMQITAYGDTRTIADDRCTMIQYADPVDASAPQVSAVSAVWTTDCGWTKARAGVTGFAPGTPMVIAGQRFTYDGEAEGRVRRGRLTSNIVENYELTPAWIGTLGDFIAETRAYDSFGNVQKVTSSRAGVAAVTRTTTYTYDAFGITTTSVTASASDVNQPAVVQQIRLPIGSADPIAPIEVTYANGERTVTQRDPFGRPLEVHLVAGGVDHLVKTYRYDDDVERQVHITAYPADDRPLRSHVHHDAFGRQRFTQVELGEDYSNTTLVTGFVEYDGFGRAIYRANPFEWPELPFVPGALPEDALQWPRGLSVTHDYAGRPIHVVEADGKRPAETFSSVSAGIFVADTRYAWQDGRAIIKRYGASQNDPQSPNYGSWSESRWTALGWPIEDATCQSNGTRVDLVRRGFDRLGHEVLVNRYRDPIGVTGAVTWTQTWDSLGRARTISEPGTSPRYNGYNEWGELVESAWYGEPNGHIVRNRYDGFGRLTHTEMISADLENGGAEIIESQENYFYDAHSGSPLQPTSALQGRLSRVQTVGVGDVYYAYDSLGRLESESHMLAEYGQLARITRVREAGGAERELRYDTPAGQDRIEYGWDSAGRVRSVRELNSGTQLFTALSVDAKGRYRSALLGNGVTQTLTYDATGRQDLRESWLATASGGWGNSFDTRDADGRLVFERNNQLGTPFNIDYQYDILGRLTYSLSRGPGLSQPQDDSYTYDGLGNIATRRSTYQPSVNRDLGYDGIDQDRLCRAASPGQTAPCNFTYDELGNVVWDNSTGIGRAFTYDSASRILSVSGGNVVATFLYGPGGARVRTDVFNAGVLSRRVWDFGGFVEAHIGPSGSRVDRRIPGPMGIIATLRTAGATRDTIYVHGDGRANQVFTRTDGTVVQRMRYRAFGTATQNTGSATAATYTDDLWNRGDDLNELGIVVLGARLYDPALGRFLQRDPIAFSHGSSVGNPYAFAFSDPVNLTDPTGLSPSCLGDECSQEIDPSQWPVQFPVVPSAPSPASVPTGSGDAAPPPPPTALPNTSNVLCPFCETTDSPGASPDIAFSWDGLADGLDMFGAELTDAAEVFVAWQLGGQLGLQLHNMTRQRLVPLRPPSITPVVGAMNGDLSKLDGVDMGRIAGYYGPHILMAVFGGALLEGAAEAMSGGRLARTIGLGLYEDLSLVRFRGAITYENAGWQTAGLTRVDFGKALVDRYWFERSFKEAVQNADAIQFEVTSFKVGYHQPGVTQWELTYLLERPDLLRKTTFIRNGKDVAWNGTGFVEIP